MRDSRQARIAETLDACAMYWRAQNRIPADEVLEMREELELHLREAERDGKPPEEVVGPNVFAFARKWGEPRERPKSFAKEVLELSAYGGAGMTAFLVAGHLWNRSADFPFDLKKQARRAVFAELATVPLAASVRHWAEGEGASLPADMDKPFWKRVLRRVGFNAAVAAALLGINYVASGGREPFSRWSWKSTLVIGAATVPLLWLIRDPVDPEEIGLTAQDPRPTEDEDE